MQRFVLLQPPLPAERGCAAAVAAGEELQPGAADTFASAYAVHRPSTGQLVRQVYNMYLLGAGARV